MPLTEHPLEDEEFADRLAQYDEALARGMDPGHSSIRPETGLGQRLTEAQECLNFLETAWPRPARQAELLPFSTMSSSSLGRFQFIRELGKGGHGVVFLAFDTQLRRRVALKVPRPEALLTPELRARFLREAEIAARLDHPNLVPLYEVGEGGPLLFLVSAYCPGVSLNVWLREHPLLESRQAANLLLSLAGAMAYVHDCGVLHRDIKPGNILLQIHDKAASNESQPVEGADLNRPEHPPMPWIPRLTDFGLARNTEATAEWTRTDTVMGTLAYMSPEQADRKAGPVGPATDIYALGAVLYECLTGMPPFQGASDADVLRQILHDEPIAPRRIRREIPRDLETISLKCLSKEPGRRYASAAALAADLKAFLEGKAIRARPLGAAGQTIIWARRRPALTASLALAIVLPALFAFWTASYAWRLRALNEVVESTLGQVERSETRLRDENYAVQMKLVDNMQGNDPSGLICGILNELRPERNSGQDRRGFEWFYQWGLASRDLAVRVPEIDSFALSPDGRYCATGGADGALRLWDSQSGVLAFERRISNARIEELAFSPDSATLIMVMQVGEREIEIQIFRVSDKEIEFRTTFPGTTEAGRIAIDGRTRQIAILASGLPRPKQTGKRDWSLYYWGGATQGIRVLEAQRGHGRLRFSPDGSRLAVANSDPAQIQLWEVPAMSGACVRASRGDCNSLAFSPHGDYLMAGFYGGILDGWRIPSLQPVSTPEVKSTYMRDMSFAPDGKHLALLTDSDVRGPIKSRLTLLDWPEGQNRKVVFEYASELQKMQLGPKEATIALTSSNQLVHLVHPSEEQQVRDLIPRGKKEAWAVAFSPDSRLVAVGYDDEAGGDRETLCLWDWKSSAIKQVFSGHTAMVTGIGFGPRAESLVSAGYDGYLRRWDLASGGMQRAVGKPSDKIRNLSMTRDGKLAAICQQDQPEILFWNLATGERVSSMKCGEGNVGALSLSPDGALLAYACLEGELRLWDVANRKSRWIESFGDAISSLTFSPNARYLVVGARSGVIAVKDLTGTNDWMRFISHAGEVRALNVSPDGKTLASAADDGTVRLWHMPTGREMLLFREPKVHALAFSPDGTMLAAALHDGRVRIWRAPRNE